MGNSNSSDMRSKSYHTLPQLVERFQDQNQSQDSEYVDRKSNHYNLHHDCLQNHYSIAEHKSKLLTTITLNENGQEGENDLEKVGVFSPPREEEEDDGSSSASQLLDPDQKPKKEIEEDKSNINDSAKYPINSEANSSGIKTRELRAGSFKSLQDIGDHYSDSNNENSLIGEAAFRNMKQINPLGLSKREEAKIYKKTSCISDAFDPRIGASMSNNQSPTQDLEMNKRKTDHPKMQLKMRSDLDYEQIFNTPNRTHGYTSLNLQGGDGEASKNNLSDEEEKIENEPNREDLIKMRKKFMEQKKIERKTKTREDTLYKYNRDEMITKVSKIIHRHIEFAETKIPYPSQGAMLFDEKIYNREQWLIHTTHGFCATLPVFLYGLEKVEHKIVDCEPSEIAKFIKHIFVDLQLAIECILIMLIYIERLMAIGGVEVRLMNWKPLVFVGIVLASKFWEDMNFWNVDYLGVGQSYSLEGINQMEKEFLGLCNYDLFVSASLYAKYYFAVRDKFKNMEKKKKLRKNIKFDKFKLKQSRAGYDKEVRNQYNDVSKRKIDKNFPSEHQAPLLDNY